MKRKRARREEVKRNALVQSINRRDEKRSLAPNNLKAELRSCLEKKTRGFATIPSPRTHSSTLATAREKAVSVAPCVTRSAAWAPHRTGEKKRRSRWAMCVVLEPPPLRDTPARGRPARARHPPLVAFPLCYAPAMMAVFAARKSILGIAESDADPAPRLPPRPQLDARLPPELRWISALCSSAYFQPCERHEPAGGKEKEKGELTNFFARDTGETLCPSCVGGRDVVQVRLRFRRDFAGGHAENPSAKATTPSRARTPALARAAARSASPMDAVFSRIVAQNTRFGRFPFFASASSLAFRVVRARKGFVPRAGIHAMRRARVAGGAPARRGVAGHTPTPACAFARGPWARMRRTRGSTDRTHSAFASAITATRSRPRERVGFSNDGLVTVSESDSTTPRRRNERLFSLCFRFSVARGAKRLLTLSVPVSLF